MSRTFISLTRFVCLCVCVCSSTCGKINLTLEDVAGKVVWWLVGRFGLFSFHVIFYQGGSHEILGVPCQYDFAFLAANTLHLGTGCSKNQCIHVPLLFSMKGPAAEFQWWWRIWVTWDDHNITIFCSHRKQQWWEALPSTVSLSLRTCSGGTLCLRQKIGSEMFRAPQSPRWTPVSNSTTWTPAWAFVSRPRNRWYVVRSSCNCVNLP